MSEFKTNFIFVDQNEPCNRFVTDKIRCFAELLKKLDYKMYDQLLVTFCTTYLEVKNRPQNDTCPVVCYIVHEGIRSL